ncbi:hypothetical protein KKC67_02220 [Patescibacteria group bacterium]|nr:hypothetical protein [Patescibacteria group bacterium]MBU0879546.1 hypothetical protein [Patescibacteria group bacterium]MBU0880341.1 hypothetical protein [Patescibacteria group bacterium]MBU0897601.1 hypothetical protein [Patescibacteria group bacterium]MBU1062987.1 hypothetical protein [Patescibacteria group bacterium]
MYGPDIVINLQPLVDFFSLPADVLMLKLLLMVGWMPIAITFIWGAGQVWLKYVRTKWFLTHKQVLLAIDIPRGNAQTPKAVENMLAYLACEHGTFNYHEEWWEGQFQLSLSLEIVSIDGYIQYLIRAPEKWKGVVETSIYSQYPNAEITEVDDYVGVGPSKFPDDHYDIWGSEFVLTKDNALPIKTYIDFEDTFGEPEVKYKDTMAALMDLMSSLKKGEQIWYQIILIPIHPDYWSKLSVTSEDRIKKIVGEKIKSKENIVDKAGNAFIKLLGDLSELVYSIWGDIEETKKEEKEEPFKMMNLKPSQKKQVEAIQEKVGKLCYEVKIRFIYLAEKEVMNKNKAANGFGGFIKQFQVSDLNSLKPDTGAKGTATKINYPIFYDARLNKRKRKVMHNYKDREDTAGRTPMVLSIEELATLWHFPIEIVANAPLIQKVSGKKVEPPASLPFSKDVVASDDIFRDKSSTENFDNTIVDSNDSPPKNLPFA